MTGHDGDRAMACLSAIRNGRAWLDAKILEHMGGLSAAEEKAVRGEFAYHIAEFFYVAKELGLLHRERLPHLIARHNADMEELLRDARRAWSMGLSPQRVGEAIFTPDQQTKISEDQVADGQEVLHLDLSDVSKLLHDVRSPASQTDDANGASRDQFVRIRSEKRLARKPFPVHPDALRSKTPSGAPMTLTVRAAIASFRPGTHTQPDP